MRSSFSTISSSLASKNLLYSSILAWSPLSLINSDATAVIEDLSVLAYPVF